MVASVPPDVDVFDLAGRRLLLAEDEFMIALNLQTEFEERGAQVVVVESVRQGLAAAQEGDFDVAILDVRLSDGEVFPLADLLQEKRIPFVFHSGHADVSALSERYPEAIALSKPAWAHVLLQAVHERASSA
ncbi:response regulator [Parvularcula oceani]|uniref:response regulator n=1 Tax=Parvularcula oceani TaxID=1247963 RepID=UPI00068F78A6|nr:response regulator [Parvularcula oceani]